MAKAKKAPDDSAVDDVVEEGKKYLELCVKAEGKNREEALTDLKFLVGDQWDDKDKRQRQIDRRPCLTVNKLPTFLHQVTNDQRQNVPSIKVSPVDDMADPQTATLLQGLIRHIEYSSNADICYDTAVNGAAATGFGVFRLVTEYCNESSFDQDIRFRRIRNPFTVYMDPTSESPDGSDQRRCMITSKIAPEIFKRDYPNATKTAEGFATGRGDKSLLDWMSDDFVRVAEYYRIESEAATIVQLSNGESGYKDDLIDLPPGVGIVQERPSTRSKTMLYKITALEVLESTEIKCRWIPVFPVYGDEVDLDGEIIRSGLVRNARDPQQMYNFWMTSATEEVALRPKVPFIGAEGQFEGYEDEWGNANVKSFPYMEYKPVSLDGQLAPPPARQAMIDVPQGVLTMAMHANDNIKATTGLFDSSLGARGNATSGIQERAQQRQGDLANFHFTDNLNRTVRHVGRCIINMIPNYYDAQRVVRIMGEDSSMKSATVNQPVPPEQQQPDPKTGAVKTVTNDLTVGEYDVVVAAGPSYSTLRQEAVASMVEMGGKWPKLMEVAGDKVIRAMDWPGAEEIADRVERTIPAELRDDPDDRDRQQLPVVKTPRGDIPVDQAAQMLQEMDQHIQQLSQALQEAESGITKAKMDNEARIQVAEINAVSKADVAELSAMVQLLVAKAETPPALAEDVAGEVTAPEPAEAKPDPQHEETKAMLAQLLAQMSQPREQVHVHVGAPARKRMSIQAPSGAVYTGQIDEEPATDEGAPQ